MFRKHPLRVALALTSLILIPICSFAQEGAEAAAEAAKADPATERADRVVERIWWNQENKVTGLALSKETRVEMDGLLRAYLAEQANQANRSAAMEAVGEKLAAGKWDEAAAKADELAEATAAPIRRQAVLMIDVLKLLSAEQRQTLAAQYPQLLGRPWVRSAFMGRGRPGGGR